MTTLFLALCIVFSLTAVVLSFISRTDRRLGLTLIALGLAIMSLGAALLTA